LEKGRKEGGGKEVFFLSFFLSHNSGRKGEKGESIRLRKGGRLMILWKSYRGEEGKKMKTHPKEGKEGRRKTPAPTNSEKKPTTSRGKKAVPFYFLESITKGQGEKKRKKKKKMSSQYWLL